MFKRLLSHQSRLFRSKYSSQNTLRKSIINNSVRPLHSTSTAMSKILVVFGSTGYQGKSVINAVLSNPELAKEYKIRALSRDPSKPEGQEMTEKGIEVVRAELDDQESIKKALEGAHTVFAMTNSIYDRETGYDKEYAQGKFIADSAVAAGVQYLIWSSVPSITKESDGQFKCYIFDVKYDVEQYIRSLPIKSAFTQPGHFMANFQGQSKPRPNDDGTYTLYGIYNTDTKIPFIETEADQGKWVASMLLEPEKYEGKSIACATGFYSYADAADVISKVQGKTVTYKQVPDEVFKGFLPPAFSDEVLQMMQYCRDCGYYGKNQEKELEWGIKQANGKLTTFEEYVKANPISLD